MRAGFAVLMVFAVCAATAPAQGPVVKPEWAAAHDLSVRKGKETDWEKALKVGVELFKDPAIDAVVAVTAAGQMAVASGEYAPAKTSAYLTGLSFKARTADEEKFTDTTTLVGVEVFKGVTTGQVLYVSDRGGLTFAPGAGGDGKEPQFQYGLKLKVRKPGEDKFEGAKAFGLEAYKDNNTGGMVYITEAGMIAAAKAVPDKAPDPESRHRSVQGREHGHADLPQRDGFHRCRARTGRSENWPEAAVAACFRTEGPARQRDRLRQGTEGRR
ncbi:MAG: hypothetical protein MUF18_19825 [Fimbriiglobus sp.]|nr:hypothetical protein [Fimbriiglobus sp.]